jgi:hypothetical protein
MNDGKATSISKGEDMGSSKSFCAKLVGAILMVGMVFAFSGCATKQQLADVEAKADKALQLAQEANANADAAAVRAEQAADRAENIAAKMEDMFNKKMHK